MDVVFGASKKTALQPLPLLRGGKPNRGFITSSSSRKRGKFGFSGKREE